MPVLIIFVDHLVPVAARCHMITMAIYLDPIPQSCIISFRFF